MTHVCEVQLHLADIVAYKESTHVLYEYFRTYFGGSRAEAFRMEALQRIREFGGDVDHMISATLQGSDMEQLEHLAYLIEYLMGDVKVALSIRKRMLELDEGSVEVKIDTEWHCKEQESCQKQSSCLERNWPFGDRSFLIPWIGTR